MGVDELKQIFEEIKDRPIWKSDIDDVPVIGDRSGSKGLLRDEEVVALPLRIVFSHRLFDLSSPKDAADYNQVRNAQASGDAVVFHLEHKWDAARQCMLVYMEWGIPYRTTDDVREPIRR